ncbi:hypothetical protein C8R46DRAFT_1343040 [Mycena filopes]|nr:hypothetical protein C8R46DRAFT_1343040 [Mycena filopes]
MSSQSPTPPATPHNELLNLTQQFTPSKTPRRLRRIFLEVQSQANDASEAHDTLKRKLADLTNQLGDERQPRKRRHRHSRAVDAPKEVQNPDTIEDRVRSAGRHYAIEYSVFLHADVEQLFATALDPDFDKATEFTGDKWHVQGQLAEIVGLLPNDAKSLSVREHNWVAKCFDDGVSGQRSNIHTRIRQESLMYIAANVTFKDRSQDPAVDVAVNLADFASSSSRYEAFRHRIGFQEATDDADAFYSPLKVDVLYKDYDGTMDLSKIFRGPALLSIYVSNIRGPKGAKGLFQGESKLPSAAVIERTRHILRTEPGGIVNSAILAIWYFSADTQLVPEGDETKIDYCLLWVTYMRQICDGLRHNADWVKDLFSYWDNIIFPNAHNSRGHAPSANRQAVRAEIEAMDAPLGWRWAVTAQAFDVAVAVAAHWQALTVPVPVAVAAHWQALIVPVPVAAAAAAAAAPPYP